MTEPNARLPYLDNAKLAMMFLVIYGHMLEPLVITQQSHCALTLYLLIYLFHVPVWVFLAGFTSKVRAGSRGFLSLFSVLVVFQVFYCLIAPNRLANSYEWITTPWWILWFLLSLICWKLLLPLALKTRWPVAIAVIIALAAGLSGDIGRPFSLSRTLVWFPLFLAGHVYGRSLIERTISATRLTKAAAIGVIVMAACALWMRPFNFQILYEADSYAAVGIPSIAAGAALRLGHLIAACILGCACLCLIPKSQGRLTALGQRTLAMLVVHPLLVRLFWRAANPMGLLHSPWLLLVSAAGVTGLSGILPVHKLVMAISSLAARLSPTLAGRELIAGGQ